MKRQNRDTDETDDRGPLWSGWEAFWNSRLGLGAAIALVVVTAGVLFFGNLSQLGVWEPWEANEILVAQEYSDRDPAPPLSERDPEAPSYNWAVPTHNKEPIDRSLLKTWLVSWSLSDGLQGDGEPEVGALEFSSRLPLALAALLLVIAGFFWLRDIFDTWSALLATVAVISAPAIYMGVHTVSSEVLFVAASSLAIIAFQRLTRADGPMRFLWGVAFGTALALAFLDQRVVGFLVPMATITAFALTQLPFHRAVELEAERNREFVGPTEISGSIAAFLGAAGVVGWGFWRSWGAAGDAVLLPHVKQWMALLIPVFLLLSGLFLAWRTRVVRRLRGPAGLLGLAICGITAGIVLQTYSEANPTLLKNGHLVGNIPVLEYALTNDVFGTNFPKEGLHFSMWLRQIGFSMVPWVALVPLGLGYLARSARLCDESGALREDVLSEAESTKRLLLVWGFVALLVVAGASVFDHHYYAGYFPLLAGVGLMLADGAFWREVRFRSLVPYLMGFTAIAVYFIIAKDFERFPSRLLEPYMFFEADLDLPDDFSYGELVDRLKYTWTLVTMTFFFGLVSWTVLVVRNITEIPGRLWNEILDWWRGADTPDPEAPSPARKRAELKEQVRRESSWLGRIARFFESPQTFGALMSALFVGTAGVFLFHLAPILGNHLSQRGIFETYTEVKDTDEQLYRLNVSTNETSVYLRNVESLSNTSQFLDRFDDESRFFAVVPRDQLSALNADARKRYGRNIPVLDARSSKLLLVSNRLQDGETNKNFVADAIVEDTSEIQHEVTFEENGESRHPVFDGKLELIGYTLDRSGEVPEYGWGDTATLTTYFRVLNSVPTDQEIFLHVDYPGSRIHGDHKPVGGDYPTSNWVPGDVVRDVYKLEVDQYASTGEYTMYFGFYRSGRRMDVEPRSAHDGQNRVPMGKIEVTGF